MMDKSSSAVWAAVRHVSMGVCVAICRRTVPRAKILSLSLGQTVHGVLSGGYVWRMKGCETSSVVSERRRRTSFAHQHLGSQGVDCSCKNEETNVSASWARCFSRTSDRIDVANRSFSVMVVHAVIGVFVGLEAGIAQSPKIWSWWSRCSGRHSSRAFACLHRSSMIANPEGTVVCVVWKLTVRPARFAGSSPTLTVKERHFCDGIKAMVKGDCSLWPPPSACRRFSRRRFTQWLWCSVHDQTPCSAR